MIPTELMPNAKKVTARITATWIFTVGVSGNITGSCNAKTGDCIQVMNAPGTSFIGNMYALTMSAGDDQTYQLVGVPFMQVGRLYPIALSIAPDAPGVDYYIRVDKMAPLPLLDEAANGTLRIGGG